MRASPLQEEKKEKEKKIGTQREGILCLQYLGEEELSSRRGKENR